MQILLTYDFISTSNRIGAYSINIISFVEILLKKGGYTIFRDSCKFSQKSLFEFIKKDFIDKDFQMVSYDELNLEAIEYIKSHVKDIDILIAYELSNTTKKIFDNIGLRYIDIWLSPIRFYKDLMFEFYSNVPAIQERLATYKVSDKKISKRAKLISQYSKNFLPKSVKLEKNSALIIGQLFYDKAVMDNNKFLNLTDYNLEITKLAEKYNALYLIKHPLMNDNDFSIIVDNFSNIKNIIYLQNSNIYQLLTSKKIKCVIGISSSVLVEAMSFNKEVVFLLQPVLDNRYVRVYKKIFKLRFWNYVFDSTSKNKDISYLVHDNFIRKKYNLVYAYNIYINEISHEYYWSLNKIFKFIQSLDSSKEYIIYGYGAIGKLIEPHIKNLIGIIDRSQLYTDDNTKFLRMDELARYKNSYVIITPLDDNDNITKEILYYTENIIHIF